MAIPGEDDALVQIVAIEEIVLGQKECFNTPRDVLDVDFEVASFADRELKKQRQCNGAEKPTRRVCWILPNNA